jgi:hypothetical protein
MPQLLKRWEAATFHLLGQEIRLEVRAPHFSEEGEFNRRMMAVGLKARPAQAALEALRAGQEIAPDALDALFASVDPKWAAGIFAKYVRLPEPVVFDGEEPVTTGAALFDVANGALVQEVLQKVGEMSRLGAAEGKVSSSPSTSGPAGTMADGASPVTSTGSADGPTA